MVLAAVAAAVTAGGAPAPASAAPGTVSGESAVIRCDAVEANLPDVFGQSCDTQQWGPLQNFTIESGDTGESFWCESGWAEGNLWVRGHSCQPA